jgi:amino acid transporter
MANRLQREGGRKEQMKSQMDPPGGRPFRLRQVLHLGDLIPLSVSSVGPVFSVAATGGVMAAQAGWWTLPSIAILALPFLISSFVFRLLNRHFPSAGASYHWSARVVGRRLSRYQAWILILAYFFSIPPIAIPAGSYTLALLGVHSPSNFEQLATTLIWVCFAAVPLLAGVRPTARLTQVFFVVEMVSLATLGVIGAVNWHHLAVPIHFGPPPIGGILVVAVVAATILDGWEIDSYAAEEARKPRQTPGMGGIVGALGALVFYAILYPLMMGETPMRLLANSTDPLAIWGHRLLPAEPWIILIPILLSTAGGLWLTTYILTRGLYAMGRENLIPKAFSHVNRNSVPDVAVLASLGLTLAVCVLQIFVASLGSFFNLVLSAAGFFLLAEFFLDTVTAIVFLTYGHRRLPDVQLQPHGHRVLLVGSVISSLVMAGLLVAFFVYGPTAIGGGIDQTLLVLLMGGLGFAYLTGRRRSEPVIFHGKDADAGDQRAEERLAGARPSN